MSSLCRLVSHQRAGKRPKLIGMMRKWKNCNGCTEVDDQVNCRCRRHDEVNGYAIEWRVIVEVIVIVCKMMAGRFQGMSEKAFGQGEIKVVKMEMEKCNYKKRICRRNNWYQLYRWAPSQIRKVKRDCTKKKNKNHLSSPPHPRRPLFVSTLIVFFYIQ